MAIKKILTLLTIVYVACAVAAADCNPECPDIITRSQWGAKPQKGNVNYLIVPVPYVVIHHTGGNKCARLSQCAHSVTHLQSYHMNNSRDDIRYSFLVGGDGNVFEGRGWTREGAHLNRYDKRSIGIAFIGSFDDTNAEQTALDVAHKLITCGIATGVLRSNVKVIGARQASQSISPGSALYTQIQAWPEWVSEP